MLHIRNNHLLQPILLAHGGYCGKRWIAAMQRNGFPSFSMLEAANRRSLSVEFSGAPSGRMRRG